MYFQLLVNHVYGWNKIDNLLLDELGAYFSFVIKRRLSSTQKYHQLKYSLFWWIVFLRRVI